jgi:hypothetical protein
LSLDVDIFTLILENTPILYSTLNRLELSHGMQDKTHPHPTRKFFVSSSYFPALQKVSSCVDQTFNFWSRFLPAVGDGIKEIDLDDIESDVKDIVETQQFFSGVERSCFFVRKLRLENIDLFPHDQSSVTQLARLCDPLLSCSSLTELFLDIKIGSIDLRFVLSNDDFLSMAQAWAHLKSLEITSGSIDADDLNEVHSSASLAVIETFLMYCPFIRNLGLTLDATILPPTSPGRTRASKHVIVHQLRFFTSA